MKGSIIVLLGILLLGAASCRTQKAPTYTNYLQNATDTSGKQLLRLEPVIQKGDLLSVKVYSQSARPDITDAPYNLPEQTVVGSNAASPTAGFLVDENGNIEYPRLGTLRAQGLTRTQLADTVRTRLQNELKYPSVIVRFLNFRITVLGEVRTPSTFTWPTDRVTVLEALGLAGDITDFGNKNSVQVAREKDGQIEFGYLDLTSKNIFQSPYYRLQQNDVVFVEQARRKLAIQEQQETAQRIGIITGIVSTLAIILSVIRR